MSLDLFEAMTRLVPNPVLLCGAQGEVLAVNPSAMRLDERLRPGFNLLDLEVEDADLLAAHLTDWLRSSTPLPGPLVIKGTDGRHVRFRCHGARATWWEGTEPALQLHLTPLDKTDRFVLLSQQVVALDREVSFRQAAEAEREQMLVVEQNVRSRLQRLYSLTAALASSATLSQVARAVQDAGPAALNATAVVLHLHSQLLVPDLERPDRRGPDGRGPDGRSPDGRSPDGRSPGGRGPDGRNTVPGPLWRDLDHHSDPGDEPPRPPGPHVETPLWADGLMLGTLIAYHEPGSPPEPEHLTAVGQQIAQAVRRAGLYEHEHRIAELLQLSLLPQLPGVDGLDIAARYAPGTNMVMVGGDWYDAYQLDEHHLGLSIGDVAGHGLLEATVMARITAALHAIVPRCGTHPALVLAELNDFLAQYHPGEIATACYLVFDRRSRILRYAQAGHPPPLLIHADGTSRFLDGALATPVGAFPGASFREAETAVDESDMLMLYTDGLIERRGEDLDVGFDRLTASARHSIGLGVGDVCELMLRLQHHPASSDDSALLVADLGHEPE